MVFCLQPCKLCSVSSLVPITDVECPEHTSRATLVFVEWWIHYSSSNPFGCIPMNQTIPEIVNKDTQTLGDTKGCSTKKGIVAKNHLKTEYRASCI